MSWSGISATDVAWDAVQLSGSASSTPAPAVADAAWPTLDITPVLQLAAASPPIGAVWHSCLSAIVRDDGGVDYVAVARGTVPCSCRSDRPLSARSIQPERLP